MPETAQLVDSILFVNILKEIPRYEEDDRKEKFNGDSTAGHSWRVAFMVGRVIDQYQLPVKKAIAFDMAIVHDLLETITKDLSARKAKKKPWLKKQKRIDEGIALEKICDMFPEPFKRYFRELTHAYWQGKIPEAILVKGIDKNESTLHILSNSTREMVCDGYFPIYGKEEIIRAAEVFPQLRPFFQEVRRRVQEEVKKYGAPWKKAWDYL